MLRRNKTAEWIMKIADKLSALAILSASFVMVLLGSFYKKPPTSYSIRK